VGVSPSPLAAQQEEKGREGSGKGGIGVGGNRVLMLYFLAFTQFKTTEKKGREKQKLLGRGSASDSALGPQIKCSKGRTVPR